jgi:hypothetical protein
MRSAVGWALESHPLTVLRLYVSMDDDSTPSGRVVTVGNREEGLGKDGFDIQLGYI